jgi:large subunit ribosomal protein L15
MPIARRLPKVGFTNLFRVEYQVVNVKDLARFDAGGVVDVAALSAAGLVPRADRPVKVLAEGDLSTAVTLRVDAISAAARQKVEAAGGSVELAATPPRPRRARTGDAAGGQA